MPTANRKREITRRYRKCPIDCPRYFETEIASLSDFFAVFHFLLEPGKIFWFRGHSDFEYTLAPSALRYRTADQRERALGLVTEVKRFLGMKLNRPPAPEDNLGWMQVAQHHGLPTRLLDWTQNAAVALFFACSENPERDGLVAILNPIELNQAVNAKLPRVMDNERDADIIRPYFQLGGRISARGKKTIAINPTWNTERIALQHGCFTLHGSRKFELNKAQASSLLYVPILHEHKESLLSELERVGIGEMFIFPEPEHVCSYLRRKEKL
jgi:FRG domain